MSHIPLHSVNTYGRHSTDIGEAPPAIAGLLQRGKRDGTLGPLTLANFFVAAKSCPSLVLVGPAGSGKLTLVHLYAHLTGVSRTTSMAGHARWAARSAQSGMLVEAQTRLNKNALFALIEEAGQPERQHLPFVAYLQRISPAELDTFFTRAGLDLLYRQFLGLELTEGLPPLPLPANLSLLATLDTDRFRWWDNALLDSTLVVPWPADAFGTLASTQADERPLLCTSTFLSDAVRDVTTAYKRLLHLLPPSRGHFRRLVEIVNLLEEQDISLPTKVVNRVVIFAANAWSRAGSGLFAREPLLNLDNALQLGIIQHVLPWLAATRQLAAVRAPILRLLDDTYEPLISLLVG